MMFAIPHPAWVMAVGIAEPLPIAYLGAWLAARPKAKAKPGQVEADPSMK